MGASNYIHLEDCTILKITENAFLIMYNEQYWIPISQIADYETYKEGDSGVTISISEWIAEKKGISVE